jgi:hypothetical protein
LLLVLFFGHPKYHLLRPVEEEGLLLYLYPESGIHRLKELDSQNVTIIYTIKNPTP